MRAACRLAPFIPGLLLALTAGALCPSAGGQPRPEASPAAGERFLSQVGRRVVARADVGVFGRVERITRFRGTTIGRIRTERVLRGVAVRRGEAFVVMAGDPGYFGAVGDEIAIFAVRFGRTQFRALSRITLDTKSGRRRLELLERVLEIEQLPEPTFSRALKLKELFFRLLVDRSPDVRVLAVRELVSLSARRADVFLRRDLSRINQLDLMTHVPQSARVQVNQLVDRLRRLPDRNEDRVRFHRRAMEHARDESSTVDVLLRATDELGRDALTLLITALDNRYPRVREIAAMRLGRVGDPVAVPALLGQLREEPVAAVQSTILDALGQLKATSAIPALVAAVKRPDLRRAAILALARVGTDDAQRSLRTFREGFAAPGESHDPDATKLIDFVFSPRFKEQEANLKRLRERRR